MRSLRRALVAVFSMVSFGLAEAAGPDPEATLLTFEENRVEALDLDRAAGWYRQSLGFRVLSQDAERVLLERDGLMLELRPASVDVSGDPLAFRMEVDNLPVALSQLGLDVVGGPTLTRDPPVRRAQVRVADGTLVELYERLDRWAAAG